MLVLHTKWSRPAHVFMYTLVFLGHSVWHQVRKMESSYPTLSLLKIVYITFIYFVVGSFTLSGLLNYQLPGMVVAVVTGVVPFSPRTHRHFYRAEGSALLALLIDCIEFCQLTLTHFRRR